MKKRIWNHVVKKKVLNSVIGVLTYAEHLLATKGSCILLAAGSKGFTNLIWCVLLEIWNIKVCGHANLACCVSGTSIPITSRLLPKNTDNQISNMVIMTRSNNKANSKLHTCCTVVTSSRGVKNCLYQHQNRNELKSQQISANTNQVFFPCADIVESEVGSGRSKISILGWQYSFVMLHFIRRTDFLDKNLVFWHFSYSLQCWFSNNLNNKL